jgi:hypothetical protein
VADPGPPVEVELTIAARPETIFRYFTDPARWPTTSAWSSGWPAGRGWSSGAPRSPATTSSASPGRPWVRARPSWPAAPNVAGTDLDGRFRWVTGFWDPPVDRPEPPQHP